jgi:hypothetical protein
MGWKGVIDNGDPNYTGMTPTTPAAMTTPNDNNQIIETHNVHGNERCRYNPILEVIVVDDDMVNSSPDVNHHHHHFPKFNIFQLMLFFVDCNKHERTILHEYCW